MLENPTNASFTHCDFFDNSVGSTGLAGAAYLFGGQTSFESCTFGSNGGGTESGGAILLDSARAQFGSCSFFDNTATEQGGAVYSMHGSHALFKGQGCTFVNNSADTYGGAVCIDSDSNLTFNGCKFSANSVPGVRGGKGQGGAFYSNPGTNAEFNSCEFNNNTVLSGDAQGGSMSLFGTTSISSSVFSASQVGSSGIGAAVYSAPAARSYFESCNFVRNGMTDTKVAGGAFYLDGNASFNRCNFVENAAAGGGAGYVKDTGILTAADCTFSRNAASDSSAQQGCKVPTNDGTVMGSGGALVISGGRADLTGSMFKGNQAVANGGAIFSANKSRVTLDNTSYVGNSAFCGGALAMIMPSAVSWQQLCPSLRITGYNNTAKEVGGLGYLTGQDPPHCVDQMRAMMPDAGHAGLYGDVFATDPVKISVLSVQGDAYNKTRTYDVYPLQKLAFEFSVHDAFEQPCIQQPALAIQLKPQPPQMRFTGSLEAPLHATGIANMSGPYSIQLLEGFEGQSFNLTVETSALSATKLALPFQVVSCAPG